LRRGTAYKGFPDNEKTLLGRAPTTNGERINIIHKKIQLRSSTASIGVAGKEKIIPGRAPTTNGDPINIINKKTQLRRGTAEKDFPGNEKIIPLSMLSRIVSKHTKCVREAKGGISLPLKIFSLTIEHLRETDR
jgi:hypothetical protein